MVEKTGKINYITDIKTVCILLVFLWHCTLFYEDNPYFTESFGIISPTASFVGNIFNVTLIASFVFCAGFVYARSLEMRHRTILQSIWERFKRLIIPYYILGTIWLVPLYTLFDIKAFGRPDGAGLAEGYKCMALGQFSDHLWFLWMLFWVALFFILLSPLTKKHLQVVLFLITVSAAFCVDIFMYDFPYFKLSQIAPYLICFFAGEFCYGIRERLEALSKIIHRLLAGLFFAVVIVHAVILPSHFAWLYIARLSGALFTLFLFMSLEENKVWRRITDTRIFGFLVKNQLDIYFIHMPLPYLFVRILRPYVGNIPPLCILINYALVLLFGMSIVMIYIRIKKCFIKSKD